MPESLKETTVTVECTECRAQMQLRIGLNPPLGSSMVECPVCHKNVIALVPGPILDGPFPSSR